MALGGVEIERHKAKRGVQSECCLCLAAVSSDQQHQVWLLASNPIVFPIMLVGYVALKRYPGTCVSGTLVGYGEQPALSWLDVQGVNMVKLVSNYPDSIRPSCERHCAIEVSA